MCFCILIALQSRLTRLLRSFISSASRDIKGANILVDINGRVKLADFGMAKQICETNSLAAKSGIKGSPFWMAPEVRTTILLLLFRKRFPLCEVLMDRKDVRSFSMVSLSERPAPEVREWAHTGFRYTTDAAFCGSMVDMNGVRSSSRGSRRRLAKLLTGDLYVRFMWGLG